MSGTPPTVGGHHGPALGCPRGSWWDPHSAAQRCLLPRCPRPSDFIDTFTDEMQRKSCALSSEPSCVALRLQFLLMNAENADPLPLLSIEECWGVGPLVQTTVSPYTPADQQALQGD